MSSVQAHKDRLFHTFIEQSPVAMALFYGPEFMITMANESVLAYWNRTREQVMNKPLFEALPEVAGQGFEELLTGVYTTGERFVAKELSVDLLRNGQLERTYVDFVYDPFYETDPATGTDVITGISVTCTEVTGVVTARQKLEAEQRQLLALFDQSPVAITLISRQDLVFRMVNPFYAELTGRQPDQLVGKTLLEALPELEGQGFDRLLNQVIDTGIPYVAYEAPVHVVRGGQLETIYVHFMYQPQRDTDGSTSGVLVVCTDVTQQVLARQKIEESEARFRSLIEESPVATALFVGPELIIDIANELMIRFFGKGPSIVGKPIREVLTTPGADESATALLNQVFTTGNPFTAAAAPASLTIDGVPGTYYFDLSLKPLCNAAGAVYAVLETATDVTEQVVSQQKVQVSEERYRVLSAELERQVQERTEALEVANEELAASNEELIESNHLLLRSNDSLQKFAYVASHDLQEPLRKIQQFGDLLKSQYAESLDGGVDYLERMQSAASRMSMLIRDLLNFSRISTQRDANVPVPLGEVVSAVLTDLDLAIAEARAVIDVGPLPTIMGDALQLRQLVQNMLSNALKFRRADVPPVITISSRLILAADLPPALKPIQTAAVYYRIDVADNGIGFDDKYADQIFEVFQRLHGRSGFAGTGIGLAIVQKVVENHGGAIKVASRPGQGATFSVYLPHTGVGAAGLTNSSR